MAGAINWTQFKIYFEYKKCRKIRIFLFYMSYILVSVLSQRKKKGPQWVQWKQFNVCLCKMLECVQTFSQYFICTCRRSLKITLHALSLRPSAWWITSDLMQCLTSDSLDAVAVLFSCSQVFLKSGNSNRDWYKLS